MRIILTICLLIISFTQSQSQVIEFDKLDTARVFTSIKEAMVNPSQVYRLNLTRKRLKDFPREIYLFENLNELILDKNKLRTLPDSIQHLQNLQILSAEKNKLDTINPAICSLRNLQVLKLGDNYVSGIPDEINKLKKLRVLSLWSNVIGYYPVSLAKMENLEWLDLLGNEMSESEQRRVLSLIGDGVKIELSPPCDCTFEDE